MSSREQFEEAFPVPDNIAWSEGHQSYGYIRRNGRDLSPVHRYRSMWKAWQASRQALVVELPEEYVLPPATDYDTLTAACRQQDREAIEAAGVRVKA